jgi:HK97 family phage major capsid protein
MPYNDQTTRSDAGALMPEDVSREIIQSLPAQSALLTLARRTTMSRKQKRMPCLSALPLAYWVDGDTGLKQTSKAAWTNKYLEAEELAVIIPVPEAVIDDADYDIWGETRPLIAEAMGKALDEAGIFGINKPASWPAAVVPAAIAAGNAISRAALSATNDIAAEVNNAMALVESDGFMTDGHLARMEMKGVLRGLRDQNRQPIFNEGLAGQTPNTLYGDPLQFLKNGAWPAAAAGVADLITGDFRQIMIGIRQDITFKILTEAVIQDGAGAIVYNLAQQDMVAMRVVFRVGYQIANPINRMNTNGSTRYPFAVVRTAP